MGVERQQGAICQAKAEPELDIPKSRKRPRSWVQTEP